MANDYYQKGGGIGSFPFFYQGVFDYYTLYKHTLQWFEDRKMKVHHVLYKDKPDGPGTREKVIKLKGYVYVDEYHKWEVNIEFEIFFGAQITVDLPDGSKKEMIRGKIKTKIDGTLNFDYRSDFDTTFYRKMKVWFGTKLYKWRWFEQWDHLYYALNGLNQDYKQILHADTWQGARPRGNY